MPVASRFLLFGIILASVAIGETVRSAEPAAATDPHRCLQRVCPEYLMTPAEARQIHAVKDKLGAALSGNPSWQHYMRFVEQAYRRLGATDLTLNAWTYDRWHTSAWPDDSKWSLSLGDKPVKVASYAAYSGSTPPEGITAPLVYYDSAQPPQDIAGKIVVYQPRVTPEIVEGINGFDCELPPTDDTYPEPGGTVPENVETVSAPIWAQIQQVFAFIPTLVKHKAAGGIFVFDSTYDQMAGMYTFPVPRLYHAPSLYLDRTNGAAVVEAAKSGATATLKLEAEITPTQTWQLIAYLPGVNYGTKDDEMILFTTHSDGPSISQDNGPLGLLAVADYFSHIPQAQRARTLMFFNDNRHYLPGREAAFAQQHWFTQHPEATEKVVAVVGLEHLGQIEFVEDGEKMKPSGRINQSNLWVTDNQKMVDLAIQAVQDNELKGVWVRVPTRPGREGRSQGPWYGLGRLANELGKPGFATMGSMGAYWSTSSRLDRFDPNLFCRQIATFCQLTGELMAADMSQLRTKSSQ